MRLLRQLRWDGQARIRKSLARINPQSHRAFQRKGELLAGFAASR
jgi:hypothetical protein